MTSQVTKPFFLLSNKYLADGLGLEQHHHQRRGHGADSATVGCDDFLGSTTITIFEQNVLRPLYRHISLMSPPYTGQALPSN